MMLLQNVSSSLDFGGYSFISEGSNESNADEIDFQDSISGPQCYYVNSTLPDINISFARSYKFCY